MAAAARERYFPIYIEGSDASPDRIILENEGKANRATRKFHIGSVTSVNSLPVGYRIQRGNRNNANQFAILAPTGQTDRKGQPVVRNVCWDMDQQALTPCGSAYPGWVRIHQDLMANDDDFKNQVEAKLAQADVTMEPAVPDVKMEPSPIVPAVPEIPPVLPVAPDLPPPSPELEPYTPPATPRAPPSPPPSPPGIPVEIEAIDRPKRRRLQTGIQNLAQQINQLQQIRIPEELARGIAAAGNNYLDYLNQLVRARDRLILVENELKVAAARTDRLQEELDDAERKGGVSENQLNDLRNEIEAKNQQISALEAQVADLEQARQNLADRLRDMKTEEIPDEDLKSFDDAIARFEAQVAAIREHVAAVTRGLTAIQQRFSRDLTNYYPDWLNSIKNNEAALEQEQNFYRTLEAKVDELIRVQGATLSPEEVQVLTALRREAQTRIAAAQTPNASTAETAEDAINYGALVAARNSLASF